MIHFNMILVSTWFGFKKSVHQLTAPFVSLGDTNPVRTIGRCHLVKGFPYFAVFLPKENLAQPMAVCGKQATNPHCHRQHGRPGQSPGQVPIIGATVEAPHPRFGPAIENPLIRPHDHLTRRIQGMETWKDVFGLPRLIGNELDREGPLLTMNPFVESAAHATTSIVKNFDLVNLEWEFHFLLVLFFQ
jgi:hypothetical protein